MAKQKPKYMKPITIPKEDSELKMEDVARYIETVRFRKKIFGGVDEAFMWQKIKKLDLMYQAVLNNQKAESRAMIEERDEMIKKLKNGHNCADKENRTGGQL